MTHVPNDAEKAELLIQMKGLSNEIFLKNIVRKQ